MPHLILEFSSNVYEKNNLPALLKRCQEILVENLPAELASCKSRAMEYGTYYIGDGDVKNAFVHLTVKALSGRTDKVLNKTGLLLMDQLKTHFSESFKNLNLKISLEINDLGEPYFKT